MFRNLRFNTSYLTVRITARISIPTQLTSPAPFTFPVLRQVSRPRNSRFRKSAIFSSRPTTLHSSMLLLSAQSPFTQRLRSMQEYARTLSRTVTRSLQTAMSLSHQTSTAGKLQITVRTHSSADSVRISSPIARASSVLRAMTSLSIISTRSTKFLTMTMLNMTRTAKKLTSQMHFPRFPHITETTRAAQHIFQDSVRPQRPARRRLLTNQRQ